MLVYVMLFINILTGAWHSSNLAFFMVSRFWHFPLIGYQKFKTPPKINILSQNFLKSSFHEIKVTVKLTGAILDK